MRITENPDEIVLRYVPVRALVLGGGLAVIGGGLFLWMLYPLLSGAGLSSRLNSRGSWTDVISTAICGAIFLLLLYYFVRIPVVTVTVSAQTKSVDAHFRRILGSETNRYYFTQISFFRSYKGAMNSSAYHLALVLENYKEVQLKAITGNDRKETSKLIKKLNKLLRPPKPPRQAGGAKPPRKDANRTKRK